MWYYETVKYRLDRGLCIFLVILFLYTTVFAGVAIWRYENFLVQDSGDLTIFAQVIYNAPHDRPFYSTVDGQNHFGVHNSLVLILLVPFAVIIPAPYVLYASTILSIAVSAVPIYLIVKEEFKNENLALILGMVYIMLPALVGQVYLSFHEINLVLPFLTFAFYYFVKERFYPFLLAFILGLTVKEDVSLTLFMFSIYAIIKKRDKKWYLFPALLSISWLLVSIKVIIPYFDRSQGYPMISYFSHKGYSFSEIIVDTIFHPCSTLSVLTHPDSLSYLFVLLFPMGVILPLLSSEMLFSVPSLLINMLAESSRFTTVYAKTSWGTINVPRHMSLMATVFLFISAIYSIKRISSLFGRYATLIISLFCFYITAAVGYSDRALISYQLYSRPSEAVAGVLAVKELLAKIPRQATVKADRDITTHLYDKKEVYGPESMVDTDYLILRGIFYAPTGALVKGDRQPLEASLKEKYDLVALKKGFALFRKRS